MIKNQDKLKFFISELTSTVNELESTQNNFEFIISLEKLIKKFVKSEYATIWIFEKVSNTLNTCREKDQKSTLVIKNKRGLLLDVFRSKTSMIDNYIVSSKKYHKDIDNPFDIQLKSNLFVPIVHNGAILGIISVYNSAKMVQKFTKNDITLLESLMPFIATTMQKHFFAKPTKLSSQKKSITNKVVHDNRVKQIYAFLQNNVQVNAPQANALSNLLELLKVVSTDEKSLEDINSKLEKSDFFNEISAKTYEKNLIALNLKKVNTIEFFNEIKQTYIDKSKHKNISFNTFIDPNIPLKIMSDYDKLLTISYTLLNIAYNFATEQGEVEYVVHYSEKEKSLIFDIKSTNSINSILSNNHVDSNFASGLDFCKSYIELLNGELKYTSKLQNEVSFCCTLPIKIIDKRDIKKLSDNSPIKITTLFNKDNNYAYDGLSFNENK